MEDILEQEEETATQETLSRNSPPNNTEVEGKNETQKSVSITDADVDDLFEQLTKTSDTQKSDLDTTIRPGDADCGETCSNKTDASLQIVTTEDETDTENENSKKKANRNKPRSGHTHNIRKKFENRSNTFTAAEFFRATRSPSKRSKDQRSPPDDRNETKAKKKLKELQPK